MKEMIIDENEKKSEEKNERRLIDLCECYVSLGHDFPPELLSICVPCLLKVALNKEENKETEKEAEIALLGLTTFGLSFIQQKLYLNEIKEIIVYHQENHNLTRLAYHCAWDFLICRLKADESLEEVITKELHFVRAAAGEMEDLSKCVDWKRKVDKKEKEKVKEVLMIGRWFVAIDNYMAWPTLRNEEWEELINSIVQVFRTTRNNFFGISSHCLYSLKCASDKGFVKIDDLLKSGAVDLYLEEMKPSTLNDIMILYAFEFFKTISSGLNEEERYGMEKAKIKEMKRKVFEKMEEEGSEDIIASIHERFKYHHRLYYPFILSEDLSEYFMNV
ncbi:uncharacterized protein MONOS_7986 [Monocercomonoides exilis]|uniref:uncharacterized protein n=1 Tax=Monocercomonoides exilis TaxID=2049356 RepID=UPI00355A2903|nr:hypothetical protein MONOS_7986 [Monocercomonoides exilis]|eukprot:MONOS_7986.1-p1 / transcript=MONOS_7986.1 / gene=MONOS_7986 / organism=Monocercomonoides_exilis_PA203 / gene_product=unspecified product / transcript_product=unspecified product / location=Mono_scaffold00289:40110-41166(+) / protein_length=333 / sequence_SO=supercontig / SO=protein_coding / is_pseudo=false